MWVNLTAQTVDVEKKRRFDGTESVRGLARIASRVAESDVADSQRPVNRPVPDPAVVDAVSVLPPADQRRRTGVDRAVETQRGAGSGHVYPPVVARQTRRRWNARFHFGQVCKDYVVTYS